MRIVHTRSNISVSYVFQISPKNKNKMSNAGECEKSDKKTDPGAIRHGNFMNYYQFHPAEERVRQLPRGVWQRVAHPARKYAGLDVGCNAGVRVTAAQQLVGDV